MSIVPIGIDLGTNNSCISFVEGNAIKCVPNPISKTNTHASVVYIPPSASTDSSAVVTVGQEAVNSGQTQPKQMLYCVKRLIGHSAVPTANNFGYQVESDEGHIIIKVPQTGAEELVYSPVDVYSFILSYLRRSAEIFFNPPDLDSPNRIYKTAEKAVITVPAAFNSEQRRLTRAAARLAGLDCLRILSEPTAAAMSYIYSHYHDPSFQEQRLDPEKPINLLMFDLGGGTFDVSIVSVAKEGFQVRSTAGNNAFGGEDIDGRIAEDIKRQYAKDAATKGFTGLAGTFPTSERATRRLRKESQKLKEKLSDQVSYTIEVEKEDWDLKFDFKWEYKRSRLEALLTKEFERGCVPIVHDALQKANLTPSQIYQCVLVGGSTRIPYFRTSLEKLLNLPISRAINPDEAVSKGAAYLASYLVNKKLRQQTGDGKTTTSSAKNNPSSTSLLDFTEVSLARGELSAYAYSIACGDDQPAGLISSGSELPTTGEHTFFIRHENPDADDFDPTPIIFYIYEGQEKTNAQHQIEPQRKLFEIAVAKQRVETQSVSFYCKLDSDGVLDVFVVDEDEHFQVPNIDLPEIQALLINAQQQTPQSSAPATPANGSSPASGRVSQFSFGRTSTGSNPISPAHANPNNASSTLQPKRRQSIAFNTSKRLPIKVPQNIIASTGKPRPTLQPPPAPRAPTFERIPEQPELLALGSIPAAPSLQPVIPITMADRFFAGYANPEFVYMRQFREDNDPLTWSPTNMPSTPAELCTIGPGTERPSGADSVQLNLPSNINTNGRSGQQQGPRPSIPPPAALPVTIGLPNFTQDDENAMPSRPAPTPRGSFPHPPTTSTNLPPRPPSASLSSNPLPRRDSQPILPPPSMGGIANPMLPHRPPPSITITFPPQPTPSDRPPIVTSRRDSNPFGAQPQPIMGSLPPPPKAGLPPLPTQSLPSSPPTIKPPSTLPPPMRPPGSR